MESERQQKAILESIPDAAWLKDREGRFLVVTVSNGGQATAVTLGNINSGVKFGTVKIKVKASKKIKVKALRSRGQHGAGSI